MKFKSIVRRLKKVFGKVHLWIGLVISLLFFLIAISGSILSWEPEISRAIYKQEIKAQTKEYVSVETLLSEVQKVLPNGDFRTIQYGDQTTTAKLLFYVPGTYYYAFLNPYTGELVHLQNMRTGWLDKVRSLHRNLLLGEVGSEIVHWVTLMFLMMMITGIVLWWPVKKSGRRQRLMIKWGSSAQKLTYDIHNVLGFYATWVAVLVALTGLYWGFDAIPDSLRALTGEDQIEYQVPESRPAQQAPSFDQLAMIDDLGDKFRKKYPDKLINISSPHEASDPINVVVISPRLLVSTIDHYFFDRYTGANLKGNFEMGLHGRASRFTRLNGLVYDFHFGNILGWPGRFLVFIATLISASLPITGFLIWFAKQKR